VKRIAFSVGVGVGVGIGAGSYQLFPALTVKARQLTRDMPQDRVV